MEADIDLRSICNALASISTKWFKIGIQLGVARNKLQEFEKDGDSLSAVMDHCLRGNVDEPLTWKSVVAALRSEHVGESGRADILERKYCQRSEVGPVQTSTQPNEDEPQTAETMSDFPDGDVSAKADIHEENLNKAINKDLKKLTGYCQQCHAKLTQDQQKQSSPQVTPVQATSLQSTFKVNKTPEPKKPTEFASNLEKIKTTFAEQVTCSKHEGRETELYCETCEKAICMKCIMKDEKHHSHKYEEFKPAFEQYKRKISSLQQPLEEQLLTTQKALLRLNARYDEVSDQQVTIESDINGSFEKLHRALEIRRAQLLSKLQRLTQSKLEGLAAQRDHLETTEEQLNSCLHFMREHLNTDNHREALLMKSTTVRQVKELTSAFQPDTLEPNIEADMIFTTLADIAVECENYGQVSSGPIDPSKCYAIGKGIETATVGETTAIILHALNSTKLPCRLKIDHVVCELVSEIGGGMVSSNVEDKGKSQCEISYQPIFKGRHQLNIKVEGQHVKGSPFSVVARSPKVTFGTPILSVSDVRAPMAVAINQSGEIVVTEGGEGGRCVTVFSSSGKKLRSFGTFPSRDYLNPNGVAVDGDGNIFVADPVNHCIQKYTAQGKHLAQVAVSSSTGNLYPDGIAFNTSNGKVYTATSDKVHIFNSDLSNFLTFSGKGATPHLKYLTCDNAGNVYVSTLNSIQVFTADGKFLREIGKGRLTDPHGMAVDSCQRVYASHSGHGRISVFTSEGDFLTALSDEGKRRSLLSYPRGLAVDTYGIVYVCDQNNTILLY